MKISKTNKITDHKFNLAIVGMSKTGKTRLAATIKGKPLICNADKGTLSLSDCAIDSVEINTFDEFIEFMKFVTTSKQFVERGYDWVCFDSVSAIAEMLKLYLENDQIDAKTGKERKALTGFDLWNEYKRVMGGLFTTLRDTNRFNALSIFEVEEKENSNGLLEKKVGIEGVMRSKAPFYYDYVMATQKISRKDKEDQYFLLTTNQDGYGFLGGRTVIVKLKQYEPSNINHIINKLKGANNG